MAGTPIAKIVYGDFPVTPMKFNSSKGVDVLKEKIIILLLKV
jgi:hypothetical protein